MDGTLRYGFPFTEKIDRFTRRVRCLCVSGRPEVVHLWRELFDPSETEKKNGKGAW